MPYSQRPHPTWDHDLDGGPSAGHSSRPPAMLGSWSAGKGRDWPGLATFDRARRFLETRLGRFAAGGLAPLICLALDPLVFKGGDEHGGLFQSIWFPAYVFMGAAILALAVRLGIGDRLGAIGGGIIAGVLGMASAFAAGIGLPLLPFSIMGLIFLIGVLGLTPWLVTWIYGRECLRAFQAAQSQGGRAKAVAGTILGIAIAGGLPITAHQVSHRAWHAAIRDIASGNPSAVDRARFWFPLIEDGNGEAQSPWDRAIDEESNSTRKQRLLAARDEFWLHPDR